jgi:TetR/AcrR family transcriptional regulator, regulator of autoinduction and epiphytic fitness
MATATYKEKMLRVREDTIVEAVQRLLVTKGYELMTVDEVAAEAGLAKASLYKHFTSKEDLAAAAMVRVLERALDYVHTLEQTPSTSPVQQLQHVVRWTLQVQLAGEMPTLPAQNSKLVATLRAHKVYTDRLIVLSDKLGAWIVAAQEQGNINPELPPEMVLYTLYARACDPVLGLMQASGNYQREQIVEWLLSSTFHGIAA